MENRWAEKIMETYRNTPEVVMKSYWCPDCGRLMEYEEKCDRC